MSQAREREIQADAPDLEEKIERKLDKLEWQSEQLGEGLKRLKSEQIELEQQMKTLEQQIALSENKLIYQENKRRDNIKDILVPVWAWVCLLLATSLASLSAIALRLLSW
jgi:predicted nuclease with TOPRIM domain